MHNNNKKLTQSQAEGLKAIMEGLRLLNISNIAKALDVSRETIYKDVNKLIEQEESK